MNITRFFEHWSIVEDPFRAEEARQDAVFRRLGEPVAHPDFEKIVGDLDNPSTSIVFGEKGSGKTAIRLQIEQRAAQRNQRDPARRVLLVPYDDLNPVLDHIHAREGGSDVNASLKGLRLVDHMDGVLGVAVTKLIDFTLGEDEATGRSAKRLSHEQRSELLLLQSVYDTSEHAPERTRRLRRMLHVRPDGREVLWRMLQGGGWVFAAAALGLWLRYGQEEAQRLWMWVILGLAGAWGVALLKTLAWDGWRRRRLAARLSKQTRALGRSAESVCASLARVPRRVRRPEFLPLDDMDEHRYAMFARLRRVATALGWESVVVVVDRVDEPTLVSGDTERMRAVIWPILNNKFLQMDGVSFKLLLPIELRYALFREASAFFQEARLDKQNLVERLQWTGAMLYDLCNARIGACTKEGATPVALRDLFDDDVSRQDVIDALDQMRQPRDAFKLLYRCVQEHCSNVPDEEPRWTIPRLTLESVRKRQVERVEQLMRGVRPG